RVPVFPPATIHLCDVTTGQTDPILHGYQGGGETLAVNHAGLLALAAPNRAIQLWDLSSEKLVRELKGHEQEPTALTFAPNGKRLASGSDSGLVTIWEVDRGEEVLTLRTSKGFVGDTKFTGPGGGQLVAATVTQREGVTIWDWDGTPLVP